MMQAAAKKERLPAKEDARAAEIKLPDFDPIFNDIALTLAALRIEAEDREAEATGEFWWQS